MGRMGLSSLLLGAILLSCVSMGCFNPVVVVGREQSVTDTDVQKKGEESEDGSGNGSVVPEEILMDESDGISGEADLSEAALVLESDESEAAIKTENSTEQENNEERK